MKPEEHFVIPSEAYDLFADSVSRGRGLEQHMVQDYPEVYPDLYRNSSWEYRDEWLRSGPNWSQLEKSFPQLPRHLESPSDFSVTHYPPTRRISWLELPTSRCRSAWPRKTRLIWARKSSRRIFYSSSADGTHSLVAKQPVVLRAIALDVISIGVSTNIWYIQIHTAFWAHFIIGMAWCASMLIPIRKSWHN